MYGPECWSGSCRSRSFYSASSLSDFHFILSNLPSSLLSSLTPSPSSPSSLPPPLLPPALLSSLPPSLPSPPPPLPPSPEVTQGQSEGGLGVHLADHLSGEWQLHCQFLHQSLLRHSTLLGLNSRPLLPAGNAVRGHCLMFRFGSFHCHGNTSRQITVCP